MQLGQTKQDVAEHERAQRTASILRTVGWTAAGAFAGYTYSRIYGKRSESRARTAALGGAAIMLVAELLTK